MSRRIEKPRDFPSVEELLQNSSLEDCLEQIPRPIAAEIVRQAVATAKAELQEKQKALSFDSLLGRIRTELTKQARCQVTRVINASGIVIHTNLGRAPLSAELFESVKDTVTGYGNVEFNLATGRRGKRGTACERYLSMLSGAEAATVVNNNAAALLIILNTLANRKETIVSRGELVQIGGGFRIPDILRRAGSRLVEVGSTNITEATDYANAIGDRTGLILKVHRSNFKQSGFVGEVDIAELTKICREHQVPVVNDLGSGVFVDMQPVIGHAEPTVQQSVRAGADLTCFSGDKLLGGVQAGLIVGQAELIKKIKRNPLFRAVRVDKIVFAMLEKLLRIYLDGGHAKEIRFWQLLGVAEAELYQRGRQILDDLGRPSGVSVVASKAYVGGGSLPEEAIPSVALRFSSEFKATALTRRFRELNPAVIGRIEDERFFLDLKAVFSEDIPYLIGAIKQVIS
jgi:L-seryl-tRNA(Ser) seleniumtransferase